MKNVYIFVSIVRNNWNGWIMKSNVTNSSSVLWILMYTLQTLSNEERLVQSTQMECHRISSSLKTIATSTARYQSSRLILVFTVNKDMHHMLIKPIRKEDPVKIYKAIKEHFKGGKNHHVESARKKLNAHRLGPDIERDSSKFLELILDLEVVQKMKMPRSQKFGILRVLMIHEEGPREKYGRHRLLQQRMASMAPASTDTICFKFQTN